VQSALQSSAVTTATNTRTRSKKQEYLEKFFFFTNKTKHQMFCIDSMIGIIILAKNQATGKKQLSLFRTWRFRMTTIGLTINNTIILIVADIQVDKTLFGRDANVLISDDIHRRVGFE
jgi:hypothetical protein